MSTTDTLIKSPTRTCQDDIVLADGEWSATCALPAGHGGDHDYVDNMGMCGENPHCRAMGEVWATMMGGPKRDNGYSHNH